VSVHTERFYELAEAMESGPRADATRLAARVRDQDGPFGHLDARALLDVRRDARGDIAAVR
jgi:1,4-alpha-glucan branching enzyme